MTNHTSKMTKVYLSVLAVVSLVALAVMAFMDTPFVLDHDAWYRH